MPEPTEIAIQQDIALVRLSIDTIVIDSDHKLHEANDLLAAVVKQRARDEASIIEITGLDRLKEATAKAREKVKLVTDAYDKMRKDIERKMSSYTVERKKAREAYELSIQETHERDLQRALNQAEILKAQGKTQDAAIVEAMASLPVPVIPNAKVSLEGTAEYQDFTVEVTDLEAFIKAIAAGRIPLTCVVMKKPTNIVNVQDSVVKLYARAAGGDLNWPGIKVTPITKFRVSERD